MQTSNATGVRTYETEVFLPASEFTGLDFTLSTG